MNLAGLSVPCFLALTLLASACATPAPRHGTLSTLSTVEGEARLCDHRVPEKVCTRHHPELVDRFKQVGDWCGEHGVPESQCLLCHPDLSFEPLPALPPHADLQWLSREGEEVASLEQHLVPGKVTVFDFYADWCAPCRKIDAHVYRLLAQRTDLAYRKMNVVSWESPLARRHLQNVPNLPYLVVYGSDGRKVAAISGFDLAALDRAIAEGSSR